ncbi:hypothetical protein ABPG72_021360 [Tetrahymena utriculariae]
MKTVLVICLLCAILISNTSCQKTAKGRTIKLQVSVSNAEELSNTVPPKATTSLSDLIADRNQLQIQYDKTQKESTILMNQIRNTSNPSERQKLSQQLQKLTCLKLPIAAQIDVTLQKINSLTQLNCSQIKFINIVMFFHM